MTLSIDQCVAGRIYRFRGRNFDFGVYKGHGHFIGIRSKWGSRFLDVEYHESLSEHHGTISDVEDTGRVVPDGIAIATELGIGETDGRQHYLPNDALFAFLDGLTVWATCRTCSGQGLIQNAEGRWTRCMICSGRGHVPS